MATNLSECHVSNKRTPRALTLPPAKAHLPPTPGRNGRKPKGPVVPLHPSPGPSKAKTQAGRPGPRGVKRAGIKSVWPGPWPPHPPPGPPQATTQAGRPGPRAPTTPPKGTRKPPEIPRKTRIEAGRVPVEARGVQRPKKQAKTAPQVGQKDAKEEPWPHRVAKRVPKRSPISLKMPTFGILVLKV